MAKPASLLEALSMQMNPGLSLEDLRQPRLVVDKPNPPPSKKVKQSKKAGKERSFRRF
jgi:hypothetical protein